MHITRSVPTKITILFNSKLYSKEKLESIACVSAANLLITLPVLVFAKNFIFLFIIIDNNFSKIVLAANKFPMAKLQERKNAITIKIPVNNNNDIGNEPEIKK